MLPPPPGRTKVATSRGDALAAARSSASVSPSPREPCPAADHAARSAAAARRAARRAARTAERPSSPSSGVGMGGAADSCASRSASTRLAAEMTAASTAAATAVSGGGALPPRCILGEGKEERQGWGGGEAARAWGVGDGGTKPRRKKKMWGDGERGVQQRGGNDPDGSKRR